MTAKLKSAFTTIMSVIILITISSKANSQSILDKLRKKGEDAINKKADEILNGKKGSNSGDGKHQNSELKESDYFQSNSVPPYDPNNTRIKIAKNLVVDIKGRYPKGYEPKWRSITYNTSPIDFSVENWVAPNSGLQTDPRYMSIGDYQGKAGLRFSAFIGCDCFADIIIKDSIAAITDKPQTFKVTNFRKILNERVVSDACKSSTNNMYTDGGFEGKVTLSANENGDINVDLVIENYTVGYQPSFQKEYLPSTVSYRYFVKGLILENEMSAEKATEIVRQEEEAKQKQKDYIAKTTKQADLLQKQIAKKYPQANSKDCFYSSSGGYISTSTVNEYWSDTREYAGSRTEYDLNIKTEIQNKCGYNLMFVGIQQFYDEEQGYYLKEVTKIMPAHYSYSSDQGIMTSLFTSLIGGGSEFNIKVQDKYYPSYASVGSVQWLKVIRK